MLNARDNFLETLHHGKPDAFVNEWGTLRLCV